MSIYDLHARGFTDGYSHGIDGKPNQFGAPIDVFVLCPDLVRAWRTGYEEGFARGKADRSQMIAARDERLAAERAEQTQDRDRDV